MDSSDWIPLEEDIPPDRLVVLCCDAYNEFISLGLYIESSDCFQMMNVRNMEIDSQVTHWMFLPDLPEI